MHCFPIYRYGGGYHLFKGYRSHKLFSGSGKKAFDVGVGAGFAGETVSGLASMEAYHRYKQYRAMIRLKKYGKMVLSS